MELELVKDGSFMMVIHLANCVPDFSKVKALVSGKKLENSNFLTIETGSAARGQFFIDILLSNMVLGDFTGNLTCPMLDNFSVTVESELGGDIEFDSNVTPIVSSQRCVAVVGPTVLLQVTQLHLEGTFNNWRTNPLWNTPQGLTTTCHFTSLFVPQYSWPVFGGLYSPFSFPPRESPLIRIKIISFPFDSKDFDDVDSFTAKARIEIYVVVKQHTKGTIEFMKNNDNAKHFSLEISGEKELGGTVKHVFHKRTKVIVFVNASASAPPPPRCYHLLDFVVLGENELGKFEPINYVKPS